MSIIKNASKMFKPRAPKSVAQAMEEGAKIVPHFHDTGRDARGNRIDRDQQARDRAASVLVLIKEAKAAIAKADGLPPLDKVQRTYSVAYEANGMAQAALTAMRRKAVASGEGVKYPGLQEASAKANERYQTLLRTGDALSAVGAAEKAKAELPALLAERDA